MTINSSANFKEKTTTLKALLFQFDEKLEETKKEIINSLLNSVPNKPNDFKLLHQLLLSLLAYPSSKGMYSFTKNSMQSLLSKLENNPSLQTKLAGTGLVNTPIECNFSYEKVCFLIQQYSNQVFIHSATSSIETQKAVLKLILPSVEYSLIHEGEKDLKNRIAKLHTSKTQTDLEWLINCINNSQKSDEQKAFIYNQLGIFITWKVSDLTNSVSNLRGLNFPLYYHTKNIEKNIDFNNQLKKKLPKPTELSNEQKKQLINSAKLTLLYLYRETEPFKNANDDDITVFKLEHGITIALFGSKLEKRYSLESYIGYLVLKNNIPASYGGGWIFGERSQFGINILEAFRGAESSLIITELLRVYHQHFSVQRFVVKPYQFGLHNSEAIKTGAFWFYYKFGFRPENKKLQELALFELEQKTINPKHKSSDATLKKFTKSNIALQISESSYPNYDAEEISKSITNYINTKFEGNRKKALDSSFKLLSKNLELKKHNLNSADVEYAKQISILCCMKPNSNEWQKKNKKNILLLISLKPSKTELPWIQHLQKFKNLL